MDQKHMRQLSTLLLASLICLARSLQSACNTASPDAPEARSLLVFHWRVREDVAPQLIPAMLLAERNNPAMSRAAR
jgi:hypothetical protein